MDKDTREELQRLEEELLEQECEEITEEELLEDIKKTLTETAVPAFENPDEIKDPEEPLVYCNYSNDYCGQLQEFADNGGEEKSEAPRVNNKLTVGLLITASALCLGIIGILIYWLNVFF